MATISADTVLVPLSDEDDAEDTCGALVEYIETDTRVVLVYVSEKAGGAPDKTSPDHDREYAQRLFAVGRAPLEDEDRSIDTRVLFGTDIAETIHQTALDEDADLLVFSPREASRLARFLSGDVALDLITDPDVPVLTLPQPTSGDG